MGKLYSKLKNGYQKRVVDRNLDLIKEVISENKKGLGRQITVSPTGSGKTFMMAAVIEAGLKLEKEPSFVWLTHNKQILVQTENEISDALGSSMATAFDIERGVETFGARVLLFNIQKGASEKIAIPWLRKWNQRQEDFGKPVIVIVDEADEGMSGGNIANLRAVLKPCLELGFTASFKKKDGEFEYERVAYSEVIEAGMLVQSIQYQASDEVNRQEMMRRAIGQRNHLEKVAQHLKQIDRYFLPKMLIQAPARECEAVATELRNELGLSASEFAGQAIVHTQTSRGLEEVENMDNVRYIIGDLMVERGWNCPEAYVLLSTKDSLSVAKGIQLLGRVIRLPKCEPFDEIFSIFNAAYVYVAGKHAIEESCRKFSDDGIVELPPPKEVVQVYKRVGIDVPTIPTFSDELDKDPEDRDLFGTTDLICDVLDKIRKDCLSTLPSITGGSLSLVKGSVSRAPIETVEAGWNIEQTKKLLVSSLSRHLPKNYAVVVAIQYQTHIKPLGGLSSLSGFIKPMAEMIKNSTIIRKISESLIYVQIGYEWSPHKLVIAQPLPTEFRKSLYSKMQLNNEERELAHFLDEFCEKHAFFWVRNEPSDVRLFRGHYPDFIVFSDDNYVFLEFKGKHLLDTPDSVRKNSIGQLAAAYFMVYLKSDSNQLMQKGVSGEPDTVFSEIDLISALKTRKVRTGT